MHTLPETLLAAQQKPDRLPTAVVKVTNRCGGVVQPDWETLYTGAEPAGPHAAAIAPDGSLLRARITPASDARRLYRQRVAGPGPGADFSQWLYTGYYNALAVATACYDMEVSLVWIESNRQVRRLVSTDGGVTFGTPETIDYAPGTAIGGLAAAYRPNGDFTIFFVCQSKLYVKKRVGGVWQARIAWDKTTGTLSGVAAVYRSDWLLLVSGQDTAGHYRLWRLVYGDGGELAAGSWSPLAVIASAPAGGEFSYMHPSLAYPEVCRCSFVEVYTGEQPYQRTMMSYTVAGSTFLDNLWREPVPVPASGEYGLALADAGGTLWACCPATVRKASLLPLEQDIAGDIIRLRGAAGITGGALEIDLRRDDARRAASGDDYIQWLSPGRWLEVSLGYETPAGKEVMPFGTYRLETVDYITGGGTSILALTAFDAWRWLAEWQAPCQFRWNRDTGEHSILDIIRFIAGRSGLPVEVRSASPEMTGWFPDFTLHPGADGRAAVERLLSLVEDEVVLAGSKLILFLPSPADAPVYSYGNGHCIIEGRYRSGASSINQVRVEGWDPALGRKILCDTISWPAAEVFPERRTYVENRNISTSSAAGRLGQAVLRRSSLAVSRGYITVPVNCGQQVGDVIDITDVPAGLTGAVLRVTGITVDWVPYRGSYCQRLELGTV